MGNQGIDQCISSFLNKVLTSKVTFVCSRDFSLSCQGNLQYTLDTLTIKPTLQEVKKTTFNFKLYKFLGRDGYHPIIFQIFCDYTTDFVLNCVSSSFRLKPFPPRVNNTFVCLIQRWITCDHKSFRPIVLSKSIYKILFKVLVNRFRHLMADPISPFQSSFIPRLVQIMSFQFRKLCIQLEKSRTIMAFVLLNQTLKRPTTNWSGILLAFHKAYILMYILLQNSHPYQLILLGLDLPFKQNKTRRSHFSLYFPFMHRILISNNY